MKKERFELVASSLGSYFGVGFNTPEEQFSFDLGIEENYFDDASQERMDLGIALEDSVLNFFEKKLEISITDRNTEVIWAFDDKLRCKVDGMTVFQGEPTVVECKVSNSNGKKFTEDKGYILQCQAYMAAKGVNQALLCGLYHGKPVWRLIRRDENIITAIAVVVDFVFDVLNGLADPKDFPYHVTQEYSKIPIAEEIELTDTHWELLEEYKALKDTVKETEKRLDEIEGFFKVNFKNVKAERNGLSVNISTYTRAGGVDLDSIMMDYPGLDPEKYKKPDSEYVTLRVTKKKPK